MKKVTAFVFCTAMLTGCNDPNGTATIEKGKVDNARITAGAWPVGLSGSTGIVKVPFSKAVPNVLENDFEDELSGAVSLVVRSNVTGSTADLASGTLVQGTPSGAGEFSWELNDDRDEATLTFYNQSPGGLTLKTDRAYTATMSISSNLYVENLSAISFTVQPQ